MSEPGVPGRLVYLYLGSVDVSADLAWWNEVLGAELLWRYAAFGADVAGVRLGGEAAAAATPGLAGPVVILADHRPAPSCLPIWAVEDLDVTVEWLAATGWSRSAVRVEVPDGPCLVLTDPSGNQLGLLRQDRPDALLEG